MLLALSPNGALPGHAEEPRFGMNRVNLAWLSADARRQVVANMATNGVELVRLSLTPPVEASIDAVRVAHEHGMRILLEVPLGNSDFYPAEVGKRSGRGRVWDMYRLSDIDLAAFQAAFRSALQRIDRLGVALAAVEPGNEINLAAYNGDLAIHAWASARTARSIGEVLDRAAFEMGIEKYVSITMIVREELTATERSGDAKVVSAGLSDMTAALGDQRGIERLDAVDVIGLLQARGIEDAIDAYGVHVYSSGVETADARRRQVEAALSFCATTGRRRPCWVTEWGIANPSTACPLDDVGRKRVADEMRGLFEQLMLAGRIGTAFYYDWDSNMPYSVWRCGVLAPTGKVAIAPYLLSQ